jgi:hypothetical protein
MLCDIDIHLMLRVCSIFDTFITCIKTHSIKQIMATNDVIGILWPIQFKLYTRAHNYSFIRFSFIFLNWSRFILVQAEHCPNKAEALSNVLLECKKLKSMLGI